MAAPRPELVIPARAWQTQLAAAYAGAAAADAEAAALTAELADSASTIEAVMAAAAAVDQAKSSEGAALVCETNYFRPQRARG